MCFAKKGFFVLSPGHKNYIVYPLRVTTIPIGASVCCEGGGQINSPLGWGIRECFVYDVTLLEYKNNFA